ncbi:MAG: IPT/TIG domain-containing protein [Bacteroidales bacterium]|jgi:N-acetylneuraminic acid mutarotase|nr:IPT/TIG domain-containing protein [Bacteroidales bacterium]
MKSKSLIKAAIIVTFSFMAVRCQEEKFTDKGIPEVEITSIKLIDGGGALFEGKILSAGAAVIEEHGFLWSTDENVSPGGSEVVLLGQRDGIGTFTCMVTADLQKDTNYYVRPFIVTDDYYSFGSIKSFVSGGGRQPKLIDVKPGEAVCGDTVTITGENFSFTPGNNTVYFDDIEARVLASSDDELVMVVPAAEELQIKVSVTVSGLASDNMLDFTMKQPILSGFEPNTGTFGDIVTLTGTNFSLDSLYAKVYFNTAQAEIVEMTRTQYKVRVPAQNNISPAVVQIKYFNYFSYNEQFTLRQAEITDVSPGTVRGGDSIRITGANFNPVREMNQVLIAGRVATVTRSSATEVVIIVPYGLSPGTSGLTLTTLYGQPVNWSVTIEFVSPWLRLNDFPGTARSSPAVFATGTHGYLGCGHNTTVFNDFWEYTPAVDQWRTISSFPINNLYFAQGFAVNEAGYVTLGKVGDSYSNALTRYNPGTDSWVTMAQKPGEGSSMKSPPFVIDGKAYVMAAEEMYCYDPASNIWTKRAYPAELQYFGSGAAFTIGSKGYVGIGWIHQQGINTPMLFEYNPSSNTWTRKADFPGTPRSNAVFFSLPNGKAYVGLGTTLDYTYLNDMWEYDPVSDAWNRIEDFPGTARYSAVAFTVGSKAYIGFGYDGQHRNDIWEFSPH